MVKGKVGSSVEKTGRSLPILLLRAREATMARFRPMLARHGVTEQQWRVLRVLDEAGSLEPTELAVRASVLPPSLTRIVKSLLNRKLVTRRKVKDDGRRAVIAIAPAGRALIKELSPERRAIYREIERRFGREELRQLLDLLESLVRRNGRD
jgi:homoprotocatechuate degradation regulator HpaR